MGSKSKTTTNVSNYQIHDESDQSLTAASGSAAIRGSHNVVNVTDGGSVQRALEAMDSANYNSLLFADSVTGRALDSNAAVTQSAMTGMLSASQSAMTGMLSASQSAMTGMAGVAGTSIDAVSSNALASMEYADRGNERMGNLFTDALGWASNTMTQAAHNARSESGQIIAEGQTQSAANLKTMMIIAGVIGAIFIFKG